MKIKNAHLLSCSVIALLLFISVFQSCKKSSSSPSTSMSASVNGASFQATNTSGVDLKLWNQLTITGFYLPKSGDTALIDINIPDTVIKNETLNNANGSSVSIDYYPQLGNGYSYLADAALANKVNVTINSIDTTGHRVSGTFNGVLYGGSATIFDSVTITNGQFNSSYIVQ
jgi:hypothetical protein